VRRCVLCALVLLAPARGFADGNSIVGGSPRAIGRAGAAVVGDDGGGALLINPAAMARRDTTRAELGGATVEDTVDWQRSSIGVPLSVSRAGSRIAPFGAAIAAIGGWIIGLGATTAAVIDRSLPRPGDVGGDDPGKLGMVYDYRYAGIAGSYRRDTVSLGVARRLGDSLALGASVSAARVSVTEHRRFWAARMPREDSTDQGDVDVALSATDPFVPSAVIGLLYAPGEVPIEIGASLGWAGALRLDGGLQAHSAVSAPEVAVDSPHASLRLSQPLALRAGGRYVGDRVVAELDGDVWLAPAGSGVAVWGVSGLRVTETGYPAVDLTQVPSRISQRSHLAVRAAVDVAIVPGFLWATGGYAFASRATRESRLSPTFGDLGGHTLGLGLEATAGSVTVTLGWSRTWSPAITARSSLKVDSPYDNSNSSVPAGSYTGSIDQVGVLVEAELGGR
jgi:hypothetical protein